MLPAFDYGACLIMLLVPVGLVIVLLMWLPASLVEWRQRRQKRSRGFEVKLNTGETPVLPRKDDDHG